ncbi:hypothetical protein B296_00020904 [Ensete ventricosum]|uniref:Uncharacterized protein n=1 Tax=Ensete ventricosum TaxID=4639 RepID=A0A426YF95_ENSVE|nr:hypothetical protein B296_00020904 [Ensete ventricosum]
MEYCVRYSFRTYRCVVASRRVKAFGRITKVLRSSPPSLRLPLSLLLLLPPLILVPPAPPPNRCNSLRQYLLVLDRGLNLSCRSTDELIDRDWDRDRDHRGTAVPDQDRERVWKTSSRRGSTDLGSSRR